MKRQVYFVLLLSLYMTNIYSKECHIFTSPPDYSKMELLNFDIRWQSVPVVGGNPKRYITFNDAYKLFVKNLEDHIKAECRKNESMKGVVNLKIGHDTTKEWYNFSATYDVYK